MDAITWVFRILWACRVSVVSAFAGVALFVVAVPAQNLMADLSFDAWPFFGEQVSLDILFWPGVFLLTFIAWAFPVHYGARLTLNDDSWVVSRALAKRLDPAECAQLVRDMKWRYRGLIDAIPRILGVLPFVALLVGIILGAWADREATALPESRATIVQAWWLGGIDLVVGAAFYLFVRFRRPLIDALAGSARAQVKLAYFAHASMVVTTGFFLAAYLFPIGVAVWFPRALLVPPLFGSLVLVLSYVQRYTHKTGVPYIFLMALAVVGMMAANGSFHDIRGLPRIDAREGRLTIAEAIVAWKRANGCTSTCPRPVIVAIDGGASRSAFTAASFLGEILDRMPAAGPQEAATPGRRIFAISGVSGGAYGAAVVQAALADAQNGSDKARPPCTVVRSTWYGAHYRRSDNTSFNWHDCLGSLTSGDYLSPTIIGLALRDAAAVPLGSWTIEDRAALLEKSWERHFRDATLGVNRFTHGYCDDAGQDDDGLCRRMAHPLAFLADPKRANDKPWVPLLLLNGTSVATGRRIIASDLKSVPATKDGQNALVTRGTLYGEAYDLGEAMSSQCANAPAQPNGNDITYGLDGTQYVGTTINGASADHRTLRAVTHGTCSQPETLDGPDIRLSTAALSSARFPLVSPAGTYRMKASVKDEGQPFNDHLVDGGYFENSGLTTALDIIALLPKDLRPILISISNDPEQNKLFAGLPRRPAETPLVVADSDTLAFRIFGLIEGPLLGLYATRDGHAAEAEARAEAAFESGGFYRLHVADAPDLDRDPKAKAYDQHVCDGIWSAVEKDKKRLRMAKVSMSWWLSAAVQADLDTQRCDAGNRKTLTAIMEAIGGD